MNLSPHFTLEEMIKSQVGDRAGIDNMPPPEHKEALQLLCHAMLEPIREHFGLVIVNSGYRNAAVNKLNKGKPSSQHCKGEAADIEVPGMTNVALAKWIAKTLDFDQLILECYREGIPNSGWVHVSHSKKHNRKEVLTATVVNGKMVYTLGIA